MSIRRIFQLISIVLISSIFIYLYTEYINAKEATLRYIYSESNLQATLTKNLLITNADKETNRILEASGDNLAVMNVLQDYFSSNSTNASPQKAQQLLAQKFPDRHYDVFLIDKNLTIVKGTYARDLGLDFSKMPLACKVLRQVYNSPSVVDTSPVYYDRARNLFIRYVAQKARHSDFIIQFGLSLNDSNIKNLYSTIKKSVPYLEKCSIFVVPTSDTNSPTYEYKYIDFNENADENLELKGMQKAKSRISHFEQLAKHFTDKPIPKDTADLKLFLDNLFLHTHSINYREIIDNKHKNTVVVDFASLHEFQFQERALLVMTFDESVVFHKLNMLLAKAFFTAFLVGSILLFSLFVIHRRVVKPMMLLYESINKHEAVAICNITNQDDEIAKIVTAYNNLYNSLTKTIAEKMELFENFKTFTSNVLHQIKTPISVMKISQEAMDNGNSQEIKEQLQASIVMMEHIYENAEYRMQKNFLHFHPGIIDMSGVLDERIKLFSVVANANDKKIVANIDDGIVVNMNKTELEYLIDNNISNAIKYGTIKKPIKITMYRQNNNIFLEFCNEGKPIKDVDGIFERYKREFADKKGYGIGLHIVKEISDKYNISINVRCQDGINTFCYILNASD